MLLCSRRLTFPLVALTLAACGGSSSDPIAITSNDSGWVSSGDSGTPTPDASSAPDSGPPAGDAGADSGQQRGHDAGLDAPHSPDASIDAGGAGDAGADTGSDSGGADAHAASDASDSGTAADAGADATLPTDGGSDSGMDSTIPVDSGVDAGLDAGASVDGGSDSGFDAGFDSGAPPDSGIDAASPLDSGFDSGLDASGRLPDGGCPAGETLCSGVCTDTQTDPNNCGGCVPGGGAEVCSTTNSTPACVVGGCEGATAVVVGNGHACAVMTNGSVECWGANASGQLGHGTTGTSAPAGPVSSNGGVITTAQSLSTGQDFTCAVLTGGTVDCWGTNSSGQLGVNTTTTHSSLAVQAGTLSNAKEIASGTGHSCVVEHSGGGPGQTSLWCWGDNTNGKIGADPTITTGSFTPLQVTAPTFAPQYAGGGGGAGPLLAAGSNHTCAIDAAGAVWCWGDNSKGQLGVVQDAGTYSYTPLPLPGITSGARALTAGGDHTCALVRTGTGGGATTALKCWGDNAHGELGQAGSFPTGTLVTVSGIGSAGQTFGTIGAGATHTCASVSNGDIYCWGTNTKGELGDSSFAASSTPVLVHPLAGAATAPTTQPLAFTLGLGVEESCTVDTHATVQCWGNAATDALGNGATSNQNTPAPVAW